MNEPYKLIIMIMMNLCVTYFSIIIIINKLICFIKLTINIAKN